MSPAMIAASRRGTLLSGGLAPLLELMSRISPRMAMPCFPTWIMVRPRNEALDPHGNIYRALEIACAHLQHNSTNTPERVPENTGGVKSTAGCANPEAKGISRLPAVKGRTPPYVAQILTPGRKTLAI